MDVTLQDVAKAMDLDGGKDRKDKSVYGEVKAINSDKTYQVSLNGSSTTVKCARLSGAKVGDTVLVNILSNGYAVVTGTVGGDTDASDAQKSAAAAQTAAGQAQTSAAAASTAAAAAETAATNAVTKADAASTAAAAAQTSADAAATAASVADGKAEAASTAASAAQTSASAAQTAASAAQTSAAAAVADAATAKTAATKAQTAADGALVGLANVQDVVGVLEWTAKYGEYEKTSDVTPDPTKIYYTLTGTQVSSPTAADIGTYYELVSGEYIKTQDTDITPGKTYYTVRGAVVPEPKAEDMGDYYELMIDDAMADYIKSHLALTDNGLYVMKDGTKWKVRVADNGVYIIDATSGADKVVATYSDEIILGQDGDSQQILNKKTQRFKNGYNTFAFWGDSRDNDGVAEYNETLEPTAQGNLQLSQTPVPSSVEVYVDDTLNNDWEWLQNTPSSGIIVYSKMERFTADGTTADFVVSHDIATVGYVRRNNEGSSIPYTVVGDRTIRLSTAPPQGTIIKISYSWLDMANHTFRVKYSSTSDGNFFFTFGSRKSATQNLGPFSASFGSGNEVSAREAMAVGRNCVVRAPYGLAAGHECKLLAGAAALGYMNTVQGGDSSAIGRGCDVRGNNSTAIGNYIDISSYGNRVSIGRYNAKDGLLDNDVIAFEVGNGSSDNNRSNAFEVNTKGEIGIALNTSAAAGSTDGDLYAAIQSLGWISAVIE